MPRPKARREGSGQGSITDKESRKERIAEKKYTYTCEKKSLGPSFGEPKALI